MHALCVRMACLAWGAGAGSNKPWRRGQKINVHYKFRTLGGLPKTACEEATIGEPWGAVAERARKVTDMDTGEAEVNSAYFSGDAFCGSVRGTENTGTKEATRAVLKFDPTKISFEHPAPGEEPISVHVNPHLTWGLVAAEIKAAGGLAMPVSLYADGGTRMLCETVTAAQIAKAETREFQARYKGGEDLAYHDQDCVYYFEACNGATTATVANSRLLRVRNFPREDVQWETDVANQIAGALGLDAHHKVVPYEIFGKHAAPLQGSIAAYYNLELKPFVMARIVGRVPTSG